MFSFRRDDEPSKNEKKQVAKGTVSIQEYNALKAKYQGLLQATQAGATYTDNREDLIKDLSSAPSDESKQTSDFTTVDVFNDDPSGSSNSSVLSGVEKEISELKKISVMINRKQFDSAMNRLKPLEASGTKQIRTQAKFLLAESLFLQSEFDLAMQVYEEIIRKDAYSSIVLKTLGRLIACSEKLKLKEKKEKYYSLLHDFFEAS